MRKLVVVGFVLFTGTVFALSGIAQRRARAGHAHASGPGQAPQTAVIGQELGGIQWGWNHEQVIDYFRRAIAARYQPLLKNKGQVEQDHLMSERDGQVTELRNSYVQFNGQQSQRRWDTSFVGPEYTHNNGESMLVYEDPTNGNREFFFFFNDRLWKRFQARSVPSGSHLDYNAFIGLMEGHFGGGLHIADPDHPDHVATVVWQDANTRLHLIDNSTFYNAFCLVYEEKATLAHLAELRRNAPTKQAVANNDSRDNTQPAVGNVEGDPNADIVDRITGKMRRTQQASDNGSHASTGSNGSSTSGSGSTNNPPPSSDGNGSGGGGNDPLGGL